MATLLDGDVWALLEGLEQGGVKLRRLKLKNVDWGANHIWGGSALNTLANAVLEGGGGELDGQSLEELENLDFGSFEFILAISKPECPCAASLKRLALHAGSANARPMNALLQRLRNPGCFPSLAVLELVGRWAKPDTSRSRPLSGCSSRGPKRGTPCASSRSSSVTARRGK